MRIRFDGKRQFWLVLVAILFVAASLVFEVPLNQATLGVILLCFACELLDSSLGMGYGTTLTPVLLACGFQPLQLVPSVLFSEFLSGFASSYFHHDAGNVDFSRRARDSRIALQLALGRSSLFPAAPHLPKQVGVQMQTLRWVK